MEDEALIYVVAIHEIIWSMLIIRNVELADFGCWSLGVLLKEKKMSDLVQPQGVLCNWECFHSSVEMSPSFPRLQEDG